MSQVYGPVPSRRLAQSLGVDPIPLKTCNYNCVYCQLGRTRPLTCARRDFYPPEEILAQVRTAVEAADHGDIDYITFVGQGEPVLCSSLGWLIAGVKSMTDLPVAVITNGALLHLPDVCEELASADVLMPTLDAVDQTLFRKVNRPCPALRIADIIEGMIRFRSMFAGQMWLEVMLVKGLNDHDGNLFALRDVIARIRPDRIHINVPVRPPAESWVEVPDDETILRATAILGEAAEVVAPYEGTFDLSGYSDVVDAIEAIIRRHPMRERRLIETLRLHLAETGSPSDEHDVATILSAAEERRCVRRSRYRGETFWKYGDTA